MSRRSKAKATAVLPEPSASEREAITIAKANRLTRIKRITVDAKLEGNSLKIKSPHSDDGGWQARLENAFGTRSHAFVNSELIRLVNFLQTNGQVSEDDLDCVLAVLDGASPRNEMEAMLAVQIAVTHILTMRTASNLKRSNNIPQQDSNALALARLAKQFTTQLETMARLQRGGKQKVTVEHIHVYPGGQAIVGNVTHGANGQQPGATGGGHQIGHQPHAIEHDAATTVAELAEVLG
jgi:hypothetical protein